MSMVRLCVPSVSVGVCELWVSMVRLCVPSVSEQTLTGFLVGHWAKPRHA